MPGNFLDNGVQRLNSRILDSSFHLSRKVKALILIVILAAYVLFFFFFSDSLKVSTNYIVLIPMMVSAVLFGIWGGMISGLIALPVNILLLLLFSDISYAPENLLIAGIFGFLVGIVLGYLGSLFSRLRLEIEEHKKAKEALDTALNQKELLMQENHHRIKNNLTVILSILELDIYLEKDSEHRKHLQNIADRIKSISVAQDLLNVDDVSAISMDRYLGKLADTLTLTFSTEQRDIGMFFNVDPVSLDINMALPIGLIVNEACTNALKHAFKGVIEPVIEVDFRRGEKGNLVLTVKDNGCGIPAEILDDSAEATDSMGIDLLHRLVREIGGTLNISTGDGTVITVTTEDHPE